MEESWGPATRDTPKTCPGVVIVGANFDTDSQAAPPAHADLMARIPPDNPDAMVRARRGLSARHAQRGLGLFGTLLVLAIAAVALYYAYKGVTGEGDEPSCRGIYNDCQQNCRRTRTETVALQNCQDFCRQEIAECERKSR